MYDSYRIWRLCEEFGIDMSPALKENRFYHVTHRDQLEDIRLLGLRPGAEVGNANFDYNDWPRDPECVYLWPAVGNAQEYADCDQQKFGRGRHAIIEVQGLDLGALCPDQEELRRLWEEPEGFAMGEELKARIIQEVGRSWVGDRVVLADETQLEIPVALEVIPLLRQETRILLANVCAVDGVALMVREPQPPERLQQVVLNCWEDLVDRFNAEHPELDPYSGDDYDEEMETRRDEALDEWLCSNFSAAVISEDEMHEKMADCSSCELAANEEIIYYSVLPLVDLEADRPVLSSTDQASASVAVADDHELTI